MVHLENRKTVGEMRLQESTWSQQYHQGTFGQLAAAGVNLQVGSPSDLLIAPLISPSYLSNICPDLPALVCYRPR